MCTRSPRSHFPFTCLSHRYLERHSYANAATDDLWGALEDASGVNVRSIMDRWTLSSGFPCITVEEVLGAAPEVASERRFRLSQTQFRESGMVGMGGGGGGEKKAEEAEGAGAGAVDELWSVPVRIATEGGQSTVVMLSDASMEFTVAAGPAEWVRVNAGQVGLFRCFHGTDALLGHLMRGIREQTLPAADRIGMLSDIFALAKAGATPLPRAILFAQAYIGERETAVVIELCENLSGVLGKYGGDEDIGSPLRAFCIDIIAPLAAELGWVVAEGEAASVARMRAAVLRLLSTAKHEPTIAEARRQFDQAPDMIDANLRALVRWGETKEERGVWGGGRQRERRGLCLYKRCVV